MSCICRGTHVTGICCSGYASDGTRVTTASEILNPPILIPLDAIAAAIGCAQRQPDANLNLLLLTGLISVLWSRQIRDSDANLAISQVRTRRWRDH